MSSTKPAKTITNSKMIQQVPNKIEQTFRTKNTEEEKQEPTSGKINYLLNLKWFNEKVYRNWKLFVLQKTTWWKVLTAQKAILKARKKKL